MPETLPAGAETEAGGGEAAARGFFAALYGDVDRTAGAYRLLEPIGEGGMGSVWLAERDDGRFEGRVAVKLLKAGLRGQVGEARFVQEGRILARLQHPNVARLLDAGVTPLGQPYLVLEYVAGEHVDVYCDRERLGIEARLRLFLQVLEAVAHAHAHLIVHRDLKPSNVLVDAEGRVKLLDFGIAKLLGGDGGADVPLGPALTREGDQPLTLRYAAPEQIADEPLATTTDVYALGVVLAELLSGAAPYRLEGAGRRELEEAIVRREPVLPSRAASEAAAAARGLSGAQLARRLRGDLDAIVGKALAKAPRDRYRSVGAFADDVERHLGDRPVLARAEGRLGRLGRFARRNRAALALAAGVVASLSGATALALGQAARANAEAAAARQAAARADEVQGFLVDIFAANGASQADPIKARATTARELLDLGAQRVDANLEKSPEAKLALLAVLSEMYADLGLSDEAASLARRAAELSAATYGERDVRTARALLALSDALNNASSYAERGRVLERAARQIDALPPGEVGVRAALEVERASFLASSNKNEALAHAERAVELYRRGADARGLAAALSALGYARADLGRPDEAIVMFRESIALLERETAGRSPELTRLYTYAAQAESESGEFAPAERHFREAVEHARRRQGSRHVDLVQTEMRYGVFFSRTEQWPQAIEHLERAREFAREINAGPESFHLPTVIGEYGYARALFGEPEAGLVDLARAVELRRVGRGGTLFLARLLGNEAFALLELGRLDEARDRLDEAEAIEAGGKLDPGGRASTVATRARLLAARGAFDEAYRLVAEVDAWFQAQGPRPPPIAPSIWLLRGELALARGDHDDASAQAQRARAALPPDERHFGHRRARVELLEGGVALARGLPAEAQPPLQRALEHRRALFAPDALLIAEAQVALARARLALGRGDEARALYHQALAVHAKHAGASPLYRRPLEALGVALGAGE